jgi:hypothetical protein
VLVSLGFFRFATLNLRADSCMFKMCFPMLAEGSRSKVSLPFCLESLCGGSWFVMEGCVSGGRRCVPFCEVF